VIQHIETPMRLHERPANLFVAGFFGSPEMNFFRGTLSHRAPHLVQAGTRVVFGNLRALQTALATGAGREIVWGLRHEDLHLAVADAFVALCFAERDLVAPQPPRPPPEPGRALRMTFWPARLHCFDAGSSSRISAAAADSTLNTWGSDP
jgi:multiple sugar transport system ATP-binding protein